MKNKGFTLIELIIVLTLLASVAAVAAPRFIDLQDSAKQAEMQTIKAAIDAAHNMVAIEIQLNQARLNGRQNTFTLDNGQTIRVRGGFADGRWNNTFAHLVDIDNIIQVSTNNCNEDSAKWCVRQRGRNWFNSRGYTTLNSGRGFVIFPAGNNVNQDRCYIYHINQNNNAQPASIAPSITDVNFSGC